MDATAIDPGRRGAGPTPPAVPDAGRPQEVLGESAPNPGTSITQWL